MAPRARRAAGDRRAGGHRLPRRPGLAPRWIPRRRCLLRDQRVPDHDAPAGRTRAARPDPAPGLLAAARAASAARAVPGARGHDLARAWSSRRTRSRRCAATRWPHSAYVTELVPDRPAAVVLRGHGAPVPAAAPVVARRRGAVLRGLAARPGRRPAARTPARHARRQPGRGDRIGPADGVALPAGSRSLAGLLRHRHARHRAAPRGGPRAGLDTGPGGARVGGGQGRRARRGAGSRRGDGCRPRTVRPAALA